MKIIPREIKKYIIESFLERDLYTVYRLVSKEWNSIILSIVKNVSKFNEITICCMNDYKYLLIYLCKNHYRILNESHIKSAIKSGSLNVIKWMIETIQISNLQSHCYDAIFYGHLHIVKWFLLEYKLPFQIDRYCYRYGSMGGYLNILKWLRKNDTEFILDNYCCKEACMNGHLETLKWLRLENDPPFPWDKECYYFTMDFDVLNWLREQNCPWDEEVFHISIFYGENSKNFCKKLQWLIDNKCPINLEKILNDNRTKEEIKEFLKSKKQYLNLV